MSKRYCSVCMARHSNGSIGLCDVYLEQREAKRATDDQVERAQFAEFMDLPENARWERVFDFMRSQGWGMW